MKQLLKNCGDSFLVGLSDHAYLVCASINKIFELSPSPAIVTTSQKVQKLKSQASGTDTAENKNDKQQDNSPQEKAPDREVQAVAITRDEIDSSSLWCAVSRSDKTLDIYKIGVSTTESTTCDESSLAPAEVQPVTCHITKKRVGFLCFASLPPGPSKAATLSPENDDDGTSRNFVVLAGDLAGDVYAFCPKVAKRQRLLLGHTASMITGVCVSGNQILTADRDEKIRVSQFPDSHVIDGFLLGHTAYVSSMDVVTDVDSAPMRLVATCGGDRTIRLWNINTLQQVAEVVLNKETAGDVKESEEEESPSSSTLVPIDIAIDPQGKRVAVTYDESGRVDLYQITVGGGVEEKIITLGFEKSLNFACQTLSISFQGSQTLLIVLRDPEYCVAHPVNDPVLETTSKMVEALRQVALTKKIIMPETILEKDAYGNIKLQKLEETRGPAGADAPWNRVERIDIHKKRNRRAKRRRQDR